MFLLTSVVQKSFLRVIIGCPSLSVRTTSCSSSLESGTRDCCTPHIKWYDVSINIVHVDPFVPIKLDAIDCAKLCFIVCVVLLETLVQTMGRHV